WLRKDRNKDLVNKTEPCQFLNLADNKCSIYEIRPADCAGFPHLSKRKWTEYAHVHLQNIDYCPATFKMVDKLMVHYSACSTNHTHPGSMCKQFLYHRVQ